jgi:hypothetical protein
MSQLAKSKIGQQVKPYKKGGFVPFEKSGKDVEAKGKGKEGSKKEEKFDATQFKKGGKSCK